MASFWAQDNATKDDPEHNQRDLVTQAIISIALGLSAFLGFCFLRPRWTSLYAARKRQKNAAARLPELPDTFFGWMPVLYRVTEEEVLASAGLDAFVFLSFFKMAIKFLAITFFFALVVIWPVNRATGHESLSFGDGDGNSTNSTAGAIFYQLPPSSYSSSMAQEPGEKSPYDFMSISTDYLWMYLVFVYLFTGVGLRLIIKETQKIIRIRQDYLGGQSTITDRTIRLSGVPVELRSEQMIKEAVESLQIGKVESVTLCRDWIELDSLVDQRMQVLRRLEEAWAVHLGQRTSKKPNGSGRNARSNGEDEESRLLDGDEYEQSHVTFYAKDRPMTRIWYGFLHLQSRRVDAIDYYEERLRKLDEQVKSARKKEYKPTPLAFVTLDSIAAAQMAVQARVDPEPMVLLASLAPAPSDVVWSNTYLSRSSRMSRSWLITFIIFLLSVFWAILLAPVAGLISIESIRAVWPQLADALDSHPLSQTLISTGLPTLLVSLLNVAVPYLYYWLATLQGMLSQSAIEMSVISKNFFFTFFNLFIVFTFLGTGSLAFDDYQKFGESLKDTRQIAFLLAKSLQGLAQFYINLIILQGLGLFPFRLLEFGSVAMYPIGLMGAKTPRDYADMAQPPVFSYGFYLPQTILIFIICTVYSVLPGSWLVLFFGLVYFIIGSFIYKYQLLYAMDHRQHSTGRAWSIICTRILVGFVVFQIAVTGILALKGAFIRSILVVPLIVGTVWFIVFYQRTYEPLMKFIALRSLTREPPFGAVPPGESRYDSETVYGRTVDESEETGLRYINPSLVTPLEEIWTTKRSNGHSNREDAEEGE